MVYYWLFNTQFTHKDVNFFSLAFIVWQGLSQVLESGCLKLAIANFWASKFLGGPQYTQQISTINMYKFIRIRHEIPIHCQGMEMIKFNYMLEIDIVRSSTQNLLGVLRGTL